MNTIESAASARLSGTDPASYPESVVRAVEENQLYGRSRISRSRISRSRSPRSRPQPAPSGSAVVPSQRNGPLRVLALVAAAAMLALGLAACATPVPTSPGLGLRTTLIQTGILVEWDAPEGAEPGDSYDVQVKEGSGAWTDLPPVSTTQAEITGSPRTRYTFRVKPGSSTEWSATATATFVVPVLPVLRIDTTNRAPIVDKENYLQASMVLEPNGSDLPGYSGTTEIKGRGNVTWDQPKKPFRLKLPSSAMALPDGLAGMAKSRHWALLANYLDPSQLRNATAFDLSSQTSLVWTPAYRFVEVVLNGSYEGVYMIVEQIRGAEDRVPITAMGPGDGAGEALTGGYLLEVDNYLEQNSEPGWRTTKNVPVVVKEPDPATPGEQMPYVQSYVQAFEDALYSESSADPDTGYRQYVDIQSLVDYYLVNEVAGNQDTFRTSAYFWKERSDPLLHFGPVWDFDAGMGNSFLMLQPNSTWWTRLQGQWMPKFFDDPWFEQQVIARWNELSHAFQTVADLMPSRSAYLAPAVENDYARWARPVGPFDSPSYVAGWLDQRIAWMNSQMPG